ncbi:NTP transferase domain-containing protein [Ruania suaedae]|uniref:molybdenum cofactor guanylyltransferase n=1 Tax=Ruania suaedae TaxID=2897774 RepID=UPI001E4E7F47|nr:NTP transferase domain-containing protein [Ruania suaedae]UFU03559.1 NTP transferase domain-containing protein [Ruania suaedae]
MSPGALAWDAVVLAGGRGTRLGGVDKTALEVGGRSLLDRALRASAGARRTVVVGPEQLPLPPEVLRTREDPVFGGPVAAVHAGLQALPDGAAWVALLAADLPGAEQVVAELLPAAAAAEGLDGVCLQDAGGRWQWLAGMYRRQSLQTALAQLPRVEGVSLRRLLAGLRLRALTSASGRDVDTEDDLRAARAAERLADSGAGSDPAQNRGTR